MIKNNIKKESGAIFIEGVLVLGVAILSIVGVMGIWNKINTIDKQNRAMLSFAAIKGQGSYLGSQGSSIQIGESDLETDAANAVLAQSLSVMMRAVEANTFDGESNLEACLFAIEHSFDLDLSCYDPSTSEIKTAVKIDGTPCTNEQFVAALENQIISHSQSCLNALGTCSSESKYTWVAIMTEDNYGRALEGTTTCGSFNQDTTNEEIIPYVYQQPGIELEATFEELEAPS